MQQLGGVCLAGPCQGVCPEKLHHDLREARCRESEDREVQKERLAGNRERERKKKIRRESEKEEEEVGGVESR